MSALVDSRALRRFVVRIGNPVGRALGTGFFVAPGWVLTCAHVVRDATAAVVVTPADPGMNLGAATWRVAARSAAPAARGALWPFPDLAVIRADRSVEHPCVPLDGRDPAGEHDCHAWGYARREEGVEPTGSPASFGFEGVEGDGFLRLKAGQAAPGLSGAPLVCPTRRAVVGVVTATRSASSDLGGWAAPVSALLTGGPGVPDDLAECGALMRAANRDAVLATRQAWNAVLPVDAASPLGQPWAEFVRGPRSTPASMLRADFGVVPYLFRDADLAEALAWCESADWTSPVAIARVAGRGGAGKTRFAIELCKRLIPLGWVAGMWREDPGILRLPLPRLVVIDYAEDVDAGTLQRTLESLRSHATGMAPVRILLLTRSRAARVHDPLDVLLESAPASLARMLDDSQDNPVAATLLTLAQRQELYREATGAFARAWNDQDEVSPGQASAGRDPDLTADRYSLALDVLLEAFDRALGGGEDGSLPPVDRALAHEEKYWRATTPPAVPDVAILRQCVALATLAGAATRDEADALLSVLASPADPGTAGARGQLIAWLGSLYPGSGTLTPLQPDRLGEALIARVMREHDDGGEKFLAGVLALPSDRQLERCLEVLARLSAYDPHAAMTVARAVVRCHQDLSARAEARSHGQPDRPGRLGLAAALQRIMTQPAFTLTAEALAEEEPGNVAFGRHLSVSYDRLADLARSAGELQRARALYGQSVAITEAMVQAEPGNADLGRCLGASYDRLGDLARSAGDLEQARDLYERSLRVRQALADSLALTAEEKWTLTLRRDLSASCNRLGDLARSAGEVRRAQRFYERGLTIRRRLAKEQPGIVTFRRDVGASYDRLGDLAWSAGEMERARYLHERCLEIRELLAEAEHANVAFRRDLSVSCSKLGDLAAAAGEGERARALYGQALSIREALARGAPGNVKYSRDLSVCYERLADLAAKEGQRDKARELVSAALGIRRGLHDAEPDRLDLAEERACALSLAAGIADDSDAGAADLRREANAVLEAFERRAAMTPRAAGLLAWARGDDG